MNTEAKNSIYDNKAIKVILYGPKMFFSQEDIATEQEKSLALDRINSGEFPIAKEKRALKSLAHNVQTVGEDKVLKKIESSIEGKWLLDNAVSSDDSSKSAKLQAFLDTYPTPIDFIDREQAILEHIRDYSKDLLPVYKSTLEMFKRAVYGKRQAYHKSFNKLRKSAKMKEFIAAERKIAKKSAKRKIEVKSVRPNKSLENVTFHKLSNKEKDAILKSAHISGDPVTYMNKNYKLSTSFLKKYGLSPEFSVKYDSHTYYFSKIFVQNSKISVIGYIESPAGVKVVSFYRSNTEVEWYLLPDYVARPTSPNNLASCYSQGYGKNSLVLPEAVATKLDKTLTEPKLKLGGTEAQVAFLGTAKKYRTKEDLVRLAESSGSNYYQEVDNKPLATIAKDVSGSFAPDFSRKISSDKSKDTFYSYNGQLIYKFCKSDNGEVWLGGIEVATSKITTDGVRKSWIKFDDRLTKSPMLNRYLASKNA